MASNATDLGVNILFQQRWKESGKSVFSSLDALRCSLPIVTLPRRQTIIQQVRGYYALMGAGAHRKCIARSEREYVELASRLSEPGSPFAADVRASIAATQHRLYEDPQAIAEWTAFLIAAAAAAAAAPPGAAAAASDSAFE